MRRITVFGIALLTFSGLCAHGQSTRDPNIPLGVLRDWMWYSERGRADLDRGEFARAELKLNMAIRTIKPYPGTNHRLMAQTYCDLARVLYHQEALCRGRAAGQMGPVGSRGR